MIEVATFDPHAATPAQWAALHRFRRRRAQEDEPDEPIEPDDEFEHGMRRDSPLFESRRLVASEVDEILGSVTMGCRRPGSPDAAAYAPYLRAWGGVLQPARRRGIATRLLGGVLAFMQARDKTILTLGTHSPAGRAFLAVIDAEERYRGVENRLDFGHVDWPELERRRHALPDDAELRWEIHAGRMELSRIEALLPQMTALIREVPMGRLDVPPMRYETQGYARYYEEMDRHGGDHLLLLLMHGEVIAGMCEAFWDARFPDRLHQELTAVASAWRRRGLAMALKAAVLTLARKRHPELRLVITANARENTAMLAINRRLGFVIHREDSSHQITREALEAWLASRPDAAP